MTRKPPNELRRDIRERETKTSSPRRFRVVEVTFMLDRRDAFEVCLYGDFNHWARESLRMIQRDAGGS